MFPTRKFALVAEALLRAGLAGPEDFEEPAPPSREDLLLAHTPEWVDRVLSGSLSLEEEIRLELPWSKELAQAHALAVGGTMLACQKAVSCGMGLHVGGGAHHAFPGHGEGFCALNDIACGVLRMLETGRVRRAAVVDLDAHQGNGTAAILRKRQDAFTFSMHQQDIYPKDKTPGTVDIGLQAGLGDAAYLKRLGEALPAFLDACRPQLVAYQSGVDGYAKDMLGGLGLSAVGLRLRDEAMFAACRARGIPVAVTLGGGYAEDLDDTVRLHVQTLHAALMGGSIHA